MPPKPDYLTLEPKEAIAALRQRVPMSIPDYKRLDAQIHKWAFVSANISQVSFLKDAHWLLTNALERGEGLDVFIKQWAKLIGRKGWAPGENRVKIIFDTNIRKSNADGKRSRIDTPEAIKAMPYRIWRWRDSRTPRPAHKALHNKAFRADSEFYEAVQHPCGIGCKCGWFPVSADYVKRNNIEIVTNPPPIDSIVDKGFRSSGNDAVALKLLIQNGLSNIPPELRAAAKKRISGDRADSLRDDGQRIWVPPSGDREGYWRYDPRDKGEPPALPSIRVEVVNQYADEHRREIEKWSEIAKRIASDPDTDPKLRAKMGDCQRVSALVDFFMAQSEMGGDWMHFKGITHNGELAIAAVYRDSSDKDDLFSGEIDTENSLYVELLVASPMTALPGHPLRKKGLGTAMMSNIVRESIKSGHNGRVRLHSAEGAIPYYKAMGFKKEMDKISEQALVLEEEEAKALLEATSPRKRTDSLHLALLERLEMDAYPVFIVPEDY